MHDPIHWFNNRKEISSIKFVYHHCLSMMWRLHRFLFSTRQLSHHLSFLRRLISSPSISHVWRFSNYWLNYISRTQSYVAFRVLSFETCFNVNMLCLFSLYKLNTYIGCFVLIIALYLHE